MQYRAPFFSLQKNVDHCEQQRNSSAAHIDLNSVNIGTPT
jgi:hypothetical protein